MSFSRQLYRPKKLSKQTYSLGELNSHKSSTHQKPFINIPELPTNDIFSYSNSVRSKQYVETQVIERKNEWKSDRIKENNYINIKETSEKDDINYLFEKISHQKKLSNGEKDLKKMMYMSHTSEFSAENKSDQISEQRSFNLLDYENKKLKNNLNDAEAKIKRLYQEIELMNEQLAIYQKRHQEYSENKIAPLSISDENTYKNKLKKLQNDFENKFQGLLTKIDATERRLAIVSSTQLKINEKKTQHCEDLSKKLKEHESLNLNLTNKISQNN